MNMPASGWESELYTVEHHFCSSASSPCPTIVSTAHVSFVGCDLVCCLADVLILGVGHKYFASVVWTVKVHAGSVLSLLSSTPSDNSFQNETFLCNLSQESTMQGSYRFQAQLDLLHLMLGPAGVYVFQCGVALDYHQDIIHFKTPSCRCNAC